jgi:hypothetical protein
VIWPKLKNYEKQLVAVTDSIKWINYNEIANYCVLLRDRSNADYGIALINKSISIKPTFDNLRIKSDLYALKGELDSASQLAKEAHKVGSKGGMPLQVANLLEESIKRYDTIK